MCVVGCLYHNLFVPQGTTIASQLFLKSHTKISVIIPFIFQKPEQNVSAASLQCPMYSASLFYLFMGHPEGKIKVCHAITGFCQRSPTSAYVYSFSFSVDLLNSKRTQIALVVLIIQNSTLVLMMHYSRINQDPGQPMYIASTAVFMAELIKIAACLIAIMHENGQDRFVQVLYQDLFCQPKELLKMLVPSGLYAIQNNLLYIALSNLEAATFQVTYQLKILSTAIFSVLLLGTALTKQKWLALLLLMIGVTLVQLPTSTSSTAASSEKHNGSSQNQTVGLLAVMASCVSSGFAGCYFEKILKSSNTSMWIRNIQLGISGAIFSFIAVMAYDYPRIAEGGMFQGYGLLTCLVVINQALGGLLVSLVVRYADNILKGFATSLSIILSSVISFKLFDFQPSYHFIFGAMLVMVSC